LPHLLGRHELSVVFVFCEDEHREQIAVVAPAATTLLDEFEHQPA
jgi:hypothetical protein